MNDAASSQGEIAESALTDEEATKIAVDAYVYASAIVQMEVHRRVLTNQEFSDGKQMRGPMNQSSASCTWPAAPRPRSMPSGRG